LSPKRELRLTDVKSIPAHEKLKAALDPSKVSGVGLPLYKHFGKYQEGIAKEFFYTGGVLIP